MLGEKIYTLIYPDWRKTQREGVKTYAEDVEKVTTLVGEVGGKVVGFLAYVIHEADKTENSGKVGVTKQPMCGKNRGMKNDKTISNPY